VIALCLKLATSCSSDGTDGRKTLAVSPGRRDRTKRPIAWAKYSGVDALVAYTPTASRGTSTLSETIRTATNQRLVPAKNVAMRSDEPMSSETTTAGRFGCPHPEDSYLVGMQSRTSTSGGASSQDSGESSQEGPTSAASSALLGELCG
jgi:hypothetical protein